MEKKGRMVCEIEWKKKKEKRRNVNEREREKIVYHIDGQQHKIKEKKSFSWSRI